MCVCGYECVCVVCGRSRCDALLRKSKSPSPFVLSGRLRPCPPQVRASDVVLPEGAVFVVANSLAISNKAESAVKHYNLRVVECRWERVAAGGGGGAWVRTGRRHGCL